MDELDEIANLLLRGEMVPFVGAGVSKNTGAMTLDVLTQKLASDLGENTNTDPLFITQFFKNRRGRDKLEEKIKQYIKPAKKSSDLSIQEQICNWPTNTIITTNFDNYLEEACRRIERKFKVFTPKDLTDWYSFKGLRIFKIHGSFDDDITLTEEDYQGYEINNPMTFNIIQTIFHTRPILYLGCSLKDVNFRRMFHRVRSIQKKKKKHFAILSDFSESESCMWNDFEVLVSDLSDYTSDELKNKKIKENEKKKIALQQITKTISKKCMLSASNPSERQDLFDRFEYFEEDLENIQEIRKSVPLGFLSTPEKINPFNGYPDKNIRWEYAKKRQGTYRKYIENEDILVKLILSIHHPSTKVYSKSIRKARLRTIRNLIQDNIDNSTFRVVNSIPETIYHNIAIYDYQHMLESRPVVQKTRIDDYIDVVTNEDVVKRSVERFDQLFELFMTENLKKHHVNINNLPGNFVDKPENIIKAKKHIIKEIESEIK